jgi:hypothetical protein
MGVPRGAPRSAGLALVAAALALELAGILSDIGSLARLGIPCMVMGVALVSGRPAPAAAALSLWLVPPPTLLLVQGSPAAESAVAALASLPFRALGFGVEALGPVLRARSEQMELTANQTGIHLALLLGELGWYAGLRAREAAPRLLARAVLGVVAALPLQLAGVALALAVWLAGSTALARAWLDHGLALALAAAGVAWIEWRHRGRGHVPAR